MEGLVTVSEVKTGHVDIVDLLKLNALLDMKAANEQRDVERSKQK
jgi:hypothetical protein